MSVVRGSRFERCEGVPAERELRELRESSVEVRRSKAPPLGPMAGGKAASKLSQTVALPARGHPAVDLFVLASALRISPHK